MKTRAESTPWGASQLLAMAVLVLGVRGVMVGIEVKVVWSSDI